jgi:hypothetical protein
MHTFKTWVDQWIDEERSRDAAGGDGDADGTSGCRQRYPDDPPIPSGGVCGRPISELSEKAGGFAGFWYRTRRRPDLEGISLAAILALGGGWEEQAAGFLSIREDLPPAEYLEVPFVRRAWRLLWLLDDGDGVHFEVREPDPPGAVTSPGALPPSGVLPPPGSVAALPRVRAISVDWSVLRALDMSPRTAQYNFHALMQILEGAGFLESTGSNGLSQRTQELLRDGSVGSFYKALLLRFYNRFPWETADSLGPMTALQYHGLYLTWLLTRRDGGTWTPRTLQRRLSSLARILKTPADGTTWSTDETMIARAIRDRFLRSAGRTLGLVELVPESGASTSDIDQAYRATPFASRVLRWQE